VIKNAVDIFAKAVRAVHAGGAFASLLAAEAFVRLIVALILAPFADFAIEADFLMRRMRDSGDGAGLARTPRPMKRNSRSSPKVDPTLSLFWCAWEKLLLLVRVFHSLKSLSTSC